MVSVINIFANQTHINKSLSNNKLEYILINQNNTKNYYND